MATFKKWTSTVLVNGQPEPNVEVHVYEPGTTNEITVYEDEGVTPITQPILTDSQGRYAFFVDVDTYPEIRLYLEKDGVDFSEVNEDLDGVPVPGASAAAGTFLALSDTPSSYVGRGGDVVLVKTTEDGIETQPWPVTGSTLNFFLSDDAADIGSYYYMYPTESGNGYSELTSPSLSTGDDQLLWAFVTEAGEPGIDQLALGAYTATLFLEKTGNKDVRVYWKLFKRDTGGTETEILQSAVSDYLTLDNGQYLISAYLNEDQTLDPTDRLVLKLYANVSGTGTDVTVTLTMEGDYDSRLTINVLSSAFNLDRLSDVTITSPEDDQLLAYDSGSGKLINQTPSEAGVLAADGSVPLTADWDVGGHSFNNVLSMNSAIYDLSQQPGITGDGSTDISSAFQSFLDGLPLDKHVLIIVPEPTSSYYLASTVTVPANVTLYSPSRKFPDTGIFTFGGTGVAFQIGKDGAFTDNVTLENISISAVGDAETSASAIGIKLLNTRYIVLKNVAVKGFKAGTGIQVTASGSNYSATCWIQYPTVHSCGTCIHLTGVSGTAKANHIVIEGGFINADLGTGQGTGILIDEYGDSHVINDVDIEDADLGIELDGNVSNTRIICPRFETIGTYDIKIKGKAVDNTWIVGRQREEAIYDNGRKTVILSPDFFSINNPMPVNPNGDFQMWSSGPSAAPDGYTFWSNGGNISRDSSDKKFGDYSVKITTSESSDALFYYPDLDTFKGGYIAASAWVKTTKTTFTNVRLEIISDGLLGYGYGTTHSGSGNWEKLEARAYVDSSATNLRVQIHPTSAVTGTFNIDGFIITQSKLTPQFLRSWDNFPEGASFGNLISLRRDAGDYGGGFSSYTPPSGREGAMLVAEDTNSGSPGVRLYVYSGGTWRYVNLS